MAFEPGQTRPQNYLITYPLLLHSQELSVDFTTADALAPTVAKNLPTSAPFVLAAPVILRCEKEPRDLYIRHHSTHGHGAGAGWCEHVGQ